MILDKSGIIKCLLPALSPSVSIISLYITFVFHKSYVLDRPYRRHCEPQARANLLAASLSRAEGEAIQYPKSLLDCFAFGAIQFPQIS